MIELAETLIEFGFEKNGFIMFYKSLYMIVSMWMKEWDF